MKFLLDTCVISELVNRQPNASVISWLGRQDPESLYLSFVTVGEIEKGIAKRGGDARAKALDKWLKSEILGSFADRILPVERAVSMEWGRICGEAERVGRKRPAVDALIAGNALQDDGNSLRGGSRMDGDCPRLHLAPKLVLESLHPLRRA